MEETGEGGFNCWVVIKSRKSLPVVPVDTRPLAHQHPISQNPTPWIAQKFPPCVPCLGFRSTRHPFAGHSIPYMVSFVSVPSSEMATRCCAVAKNTSVVFQPRYSAFCLHLQVIRRQTTPKASAEAPTRHLTRSSDRLAIRECIAWSELCLGSRHPFTNH